MFMKENCLNDIVQSATISKTKQMLFLWLGVLNVSIMQDQALMKMSIIALQNTQADYFHPIRTIIAAMGKGKMTMQIKDKIKELRKSKKLTQKLIWY